MDIIARIALTLAAAALLAVTGCVSEQAADDPQPTVAREDRGERESTVAVPQPAPAQPDMQAETPVAAVVDETEDETEAAVAVAGTIQSGWRAGVPADRNVLGNPDAQIVITEWSDYQ